MRISEKVLREELERQEIFLKTEKNLGFKISIENKILELKQDLLIICKSSLQLPSLDEVNAEIVDVVGRNKLSKKLILTNNEWAGFEIGFRKCYKWLLNR